jgi:hypothetical protein
LTSATANGIRRDIRRQTGRPNRFEITMPNPRRTYFFRASIGAACLALSFAAGCDERAPVGFGRTPDGPGARVRYDLAHTPLPDIPLPIDTATWPDPTSRTGLRVNASLAAPTEIERDARERFDELEGWGTFAPITVSFDLATVGGDERLPTQAAIDLVNVKDRHQGDDYDFENDAIYLIDLSTGVPVPLDVGNGNFQYTLRRLDRYWANDTRATERNLMFETIDETSRGAVTWQAFTPDLDTDFDGVLDVPNLDDPFACPGPDAVCDNARDPAYGSPDCVAKRRQRDQCVADHLLTFYERETDTLVLRPLLPLQEMTKYAVVLTDRLVDANGDPIKSPFDHVYHASQRESAIQVARILDDPSKAAYYGDVAGTGIERVAFTWSFTTQPTVDDLRRLRDGLYGRGPFSKFATQFPPVFEVHRGVGAVGGLGEGSTDPPGWEATEACQGQAGNLYVIRVEEIEETLELAITQLFGEETGPDIQLLLRGFDHIDRILIGTFKTPFLLEGGPDNADPKAAFRLDYQTGAGIVYEDEVQFWLVIPKETADHQQPFDVNIYGHGYTGNFLELVLYAGNLAEHGLATIGINAMGHQLSLEEGLDTLAKGIFAGGCVGPFGDALLMGRARDLDRDGVPDSGGDFWSSYLFHTRDAVRQSILDHLQLVRILRTFGGGEGKMVCKNASTGWDKPASEACDLNGDGSPEIPGDFDGNGVADVGGTDAKYGTWGESLGGILSGIHGAIDAYVTSASPGSGGGGLTDIGVRSFQGGVIEAVLLRIWGPLVVTVPSEERDPCDGTLAQSGECTVCAPGEISLRWVMPDTNDTGELEIDCLAPGEIQDSTVFVYNRDNDELRCARVDASLKMRVGIPSTEGDRVLVSFFDGKDVVEDYASCRPTLEAGTEPRTEVSTYGRGRFIEGQANLTDTESCRSTTCGMFQGLFFGEGTALVAPAEGYGQIRQTPSSRRFIQLAQMALEPGDPISFAPYYAIREMTDPFGNPIAPHAVLTVNTIGDMNVPLNSGIAFARATGALPFFRPEHAQRYPEYADYVTPKDLYDALGGKTPNRDLVDRHVIEGITALARHPAGPECTTSANALLDGTYLTLDDQELACFPAGCATMGVACVGSSHCDELLDRCMPNTTSVERCEEALYDADDLDEGTALYYEQAATVPHRLVRYTQAATPDTLASVWAPRLLGVPRGPDCAWTPGAARVTGLLDAYIVPQGVHTWVNGNPCESFDAGTYLTNLVARFFQTDGYDVFYLSHPSTHLCLGNDLASCDYTGCAP